jgi:hypothetical protein
MSAGMVAPGATFECVVALEVHPGARGQFSLNFWAEPGFGTSDSDESDNSFDLGLVFSPPQARPRMVPVGNGFASGLLLVAICLLAIRARRF